ncbi:hypothetical protein QL285_052681 [Trifolium repens]|jgi:hypothetical protein|nr:hypothetical protein QL285_052681 [Trifolium repens]
MHGLRDSLLYKLVDGVNKSIKEYREIWKKIGCTLMTGERIGRKNRSLIRFLNYSLKGTVFLKYVDAFDSSKTADMLYMLFREVVLSIGPENVVHIVTDNVANSVIAGRLLE